MALEVFSSMGWGFYSTELNEHKLHLEYVAARLERYMSICGMVEVCSLVLCSDLH